MLLDPMRTVNTELMSFAGGEDAGSDVVSSEDGVDTAVYSYQELAMCRFGQNTDLKP